MKRITVYGSLLKGLGNHGILADPKTAILMGEHTIEEDLYMISLGGFPGLLISKEGERNTIHVETYSVTDEVFARVEQLEGYPSFYTRYPVKTPFGDSEVYVLARDSYYDRGDRVKPDENGIVNWKKHDTRWLK
jgi:gamma-glutamylcyclotransferase (GGCT)/AIG2-like uncharacterized protein YtfP